MRTRIQVPVPVLVGLVLLVLVLGSAGTATAVGLTPKSVKKIATKVVAKAAPTLSVSHATTADNATNLQGQSAGSYQNPAYRFVLPVQAQAFSRDYFFPGVPAGSYLVGYSVLATVGASNKEIVCQLRATASSDWEAFSGSAQYSPIYPTTQATALLQLTGAPPELYCYSPGSTFAIYSSPSPDFLSTVTFTRVNGITNGSVTVS